MPNQTSAPIRFVLDRIAHSAPPDLVEIHLHSTCLASTGVVVRVMAREVHAEFRGPRAVAEMHHLAGDLWDDRREGPGESYPEAYDVREPTTHTGVRYHEVRIAGNPAHALEAMRRYFDDRMPSTYSSASWRYAMRHALELIAPGSVGATPPVPE